VSVAAELKDRGIEVRLTNREWHEVLTEAAAFEQTADEFVTWLVRAWVEGDVTTADGWQERQHP
jgi:hypothetical protein